MTRRNIPLFFFLLLSFASLKSQPGFIKSYDLNSWAYFTNMLIVDDTVVVAGLKSQFGQQAIHLTKFDTLGNMLSSRVYLDSLGRNYVLGNIPNGFIKLKNNSGYLIIAGIFEDSNGLIIKTDNQGNLQWKKEYGDPHSRVDYYIAVSEINAGFLVGGRKQKIDGQGDAFLMKIDEEGNKHWEKSYGNSFSDERLTGILKENPNEFILSFQVSFGDSWQEALFTSQIIKIDSTGKTIRRLETDRSLEELGCYNLHKTANGNWAYTTTNVEYEFDGTRLNQAKFMIRDPNFKLITEKTFEPKNYENSFLNMIPISSGGWLTVGGVIKERNRAGWLIRLNESGDTIWERKHLAVENASNNQNNVLVNAAELPSGNIIAVGYATDYLQPKNYGWLIKVDKNGCIDTLACHPTSFVSEAEEDSYEILAFPNPVTDKITFDLPENHQLKTLVIADVAGKILLKQPIKKATSQITIPTKNIPSGIFFYRFLNPKGNFS